MKKRLMIIVPAIVVLIVALVLIPRRSRKQGCGRAGGGGRHVPAVVDDIQPSPSAEAPADAQDGGMVAMPDDALDAGQDGQASSDDAQTVAL